LKEYSKSPRKPRSRFPGEGRLPVVLLIVGIFVGAYDFWQVQYLRKDGVFLKFDQAGPAAFDKLDRQSAPSLEEIRFFRPKLSEAGLDHVNGDTEKIVFVMKWVMNQVHEDDVDSFTSAIEAFQAAKGRGLSCESMARIFLAAVRSAGYTARMIQLVRSMFNDEDTHVTVEVLVNDHWMIFDPTFDVSYQKGSRLIGAAEIRQSLLDGSEETIKPVFYGEVNYPARLTSYNLSWIAPYNNVLLLQEGETRIPPFRFWWGPRWVYLETRPTGLWYFQSANGNYFLYSAVMPVTCLLFLALSAFSYRTIRRFRAQRT
jgi:hypothetical protein